MPKENITAKDVLPKMRLAVMHFIMYVASFALAGLAKIHERKRLTSHGT